MPLARMIAMQFLVAFQRLGFKPLPETMSEVTSTDAEMLPMLRAQAGSQSKVARLPPMIPTFSAKVLATGFAADLLDHPLMAKLTSNVSVQRVNAPTNLPKGSKLLSIAPSVLPRDVLKGGGSSLQPAPL